MQRQDSAQAHTRRPRRQVDRHAITAFGHLLVIGVWLECQLTNSLRGEFRSPKTEDVEAARRSPDLNQERRSSSPDLNQEHCQTQTGEEKP